MRLRTVHAVVRRRQRQRSGGVTHPLRWLALGVLAVQPLALWLILSTATSVALVAGAVGGAYAAYNALVATLPAPESIGQQTAQGFKTTRIYDRTGQTVLYDIYDPQGGNRTMAPLSQIPISLRLATISLEDKDFYTNPGFDVRGLARAELNNLLGLPLQGGSSITQQLVKNVAIDPDQRITRSYDRKLKELVLAWELTRRYPGPAGKDQILEWYLNTVYYGNLAYGVQAAAETYFGKPVSELTLAEAALLATLSRSPASNPIDNPDEARRQQAIALDEMADDGYITRAEAEAAKTAPLGRPRPRTETTTLVAPHFAVWVRQLLEARYGPQALYRGGLQVITSLDLRLQNAAETIARNQVAALQAQQRDASNASLVAIDSHTGQILAMLGSLDYWDASIHGQVNVALNPRQPGSAFKPITYLTAFTQGYTPATVLLDVRTDFGTPGAPYIPENYDRQYHGPVSLRAALANSYNIPSVRLLDMVGIPNVVSMAHRLGVTGLNGQYGLALTLGGGEVSLLDLTYAFNTIANDGRMVGAPVAPQNRRLGYRELEPTPILRVTDASGEVLDDFTTPEEREVVSPAEAFLVTDILSDGKAREPAFGPASPLVIDRPAAVKTGTTNDYRDNWTVGYTPQLTVGVWVGNSDGHPMRQTSGVEGAAPIWHAFMETVLSGQPPSPFPRPPGLAWAEVCALSGLKPTELCPQRHGEWFIAGTAPTQPDNVYQKVRVCRANGRLASTLCPPEDVEEQVFAILPREAADWARQAHIPQPPLDEGDAVIAPSGAAALISPVPQSFVKGIVPVVGIITGGDVQRYRLEVGEGVAPTEWYALAEDRGTISGDLMRWDTRGLNGAYTVRLLVDRASGHTDDLRVPLTIDNTPPQLAFSGLGPDNIFSVDGDELVNLQVTVQENLSMDRVEFLLDGRLFGVSTVAPYGVRWTLSPKDVGTHFAEAVAYDRAGNSATAARVRIRIVPHKDGS
ncbi:MAG: transglycosylase domain-containing protein [Anaerolineae bacterium]